MSEITPVFSTHYSIGSSVLTLEEAGKTKEGAPISICDLAKEHGLKQVVIVDGRIDGFLEAYKNIQKVGIAQLIYGVKFVICADMNKKDEESLSTESSVIVFIRNTQGYSDLIKLYNRAWTDGFYYQGRLDWGILRAFWTPNLTLALPFFSSFVAKNLTTMSSIVPSFPETPIWAFREVDSGLPFAPVIERGLEKFAAESGAEIMDVKTIYYKDRKGFKPYQVLRCIANRSSFESPKIDHLASDHFSFEDYLRLRGSL